jgi:hypothetical protein
MRNRFTRGLCVVAASAAITSSLGLAAAGAASASSSPHVTKNATTVCGGLCFDLSSALLGPNMIQNAPGGGPWLNLRQAGNARVNEDFQAGFVGFLGQFCANGEIPATSYACVNYPSFWNVFQANFAPDSNQTGLCVGVTTPGVSQRVSLVPCRGTTGASFWVGDRAHGLGGDCRFPGNYCPWINGADPATSHPLALTVNASSRLPRNVLRVNPENISGGVVQDYQQFTTEPGPAF